MVPLALKTGDETWMHINLVALSVQGAMKVAGLRCAALTIDVYQALINAIHVAVGLEHMIIC
jgi:hypothetical protein